MFKMLLLQDFLRLCTPRTRILVTDAENGTELCGGPVTVAEFRKWYNIYGNEYGYTYSTHITRIHYSPADNCIDLDIEV
jgi:hypothetical protein